MKKLALTPLLLATSLSSVGCKDDAETASDAPTNEGGASFATGGTKGNGEGGQIEGTGGEDAVGFEACPDHALLCEGFDAGDLSQWTVDETGGSLTIDATRASSGRSSLLVDIPAAQAGGFLEFSGEPLFPAAQEKMFGRLMVYFESLPAGHTDIIRGAAADAEVPWYNVGHQYGEVLLNYFEEYPGVDCWARPVPGYDIPTGEWMCWEWVFDGEANQLDFYINGELERSVEQMGDGCLEGGNQVWDAPPFETLLIGAYNAQRSEMPNEGRMWIDDVAVGTEDRLGCPTP